jgi:hypothetical protein
VQQASLHKQASTDVRPCSVQRPHATNSLCLC